MVIKLVYTLFIGILLATFVGVGIAAFYEAPKHPEYPIELETAPRPINGTVEETPEQRQKREQYLQASKDFRMQEEQYNKNVSIIVLVSAIVLLVLSLTFFKKLAVIADGLLLGASLTLIYSIIRGFMGGDNIFRFLVVTVGLVIALFLGYWKFVKPLESSKN